MRRMLTHGCCRYNERTAADLRANHDKVVGIRRVLTAILTGIADRLIETADGAEALVAVTAASPDPILADLRVPGVDGKTRLAFTIRRVIRDTR
jgi:CheY-like chemotaxis protein